MGKLDFSSKELFNAYVKATQYIMRQTFNQDEYVHFAGVAMNIFRADFLAFFSFDEADEPVLSQCSNTDPKFRSNLIQVYKNIAKDVLDSDFISVDTFELTEDQVYSTICLPLHVSTPAVVVLVGYATPGPLSKDLLNLYLALAAMIETVLIRSKEIEARALAQRDLLTKLYNKLTTESLIASYLKNDGNTGKHAFIMLDLDNFKKLNDNFGHSQGDKILVEFADLLKATFRETDILGRLGGDEFTVFMKNIREPHKIEEKVVELGSSFKREYCTKSETFLLSISIGIAIYPVDGLTFEELYINADKALYHSKARGKNTYSFYSK